MDKDKFMHAFPIPLAAHACLLFAFSVISMLVLVCWGIEYVYVIIVFVSFSMLRSMCYYTMLLVMFVHVSVLVYRVFGDAYVIICFHIRIIR